MLERSKGLNLQTCWLFWGLHFGFHMVAGVFATIAGLAVVVIRGEVMSGLALLGAGSFAMINGWQGFKELTEPKGNPKVIRLKGNSR